MAPPVQDWFKRTQSAFPHVKISNRKQFCREFWWDLAKRVINEPKSAQDFFFTELQGAEQSTYRQTNGVLYRLQERGFVDVTVGTTVRDTFTVLQILDPGSVPLSQDVSSPFKFGYDYYAQCAKRQTSKGCMKNILVHTQKLESEFRKHLPDLKDVFVHECDKEHEQLRGTAKEYHWRPMIHMIDAHFETDMTPETLLCRFLPAFFKILAVKSSEQNPAREITEMAINNLKSAKEFFLKELKVAKQCGKVYSLTKRGFVDVTVAEDVYDNKSFTVLRILHPGSAPFSQDASSPFKLGYDYYDQCEKHEELKIAFSEHLPDLKNVVVRKGYKWHQQLRGTAKEDHWRPMIDMIDAQFENDMDPETIDNRPASFLAAFFRILEIKSSEMSEPSTRERQASLFG